jgi:hypothetical protein
LRPPGQTVHETPISKITRAKWTGGVAQAAEDLFCKREGLSSNPSQTKKNKTKHVPTYKNGNNTRDMNNKIIEAGKQRKVSHFIGPTNYLKVI